MRELNLKEVEEVSGGFTVGQRFMAFFVGVPVSRLFGSGSSSTPKTSTPPADISPPVHIAPPPPPPVITPFSQPIIRTMQILPR